MGVLTECGFPGNIRELENCVYRTATLARGEAIVDNDFSCRNDGCLSAVSSGTAPREMRRRAELHAAADRRPAARRGGAPQPAASGGTHCGAPGVGETCPGAVNCKVIDERSADGPRKAGRGHGAGRMGEGEGCASLGTDASADRLRPSEARHHGQEVLTGGSVDMKRQAQRERASLTGAVAMRFDSAAMQKEHLARERQADAQTGRLLPVIAIDLAGKFENGF